jgi:hypothetical protein
VARRWGRPRSARRGTAAAFVLALAVLGSVGLSGPASAQVSDGCELLNNSIWDDQYGGGGVGDFPFDAGERITVTAGDPVSDDPTHITLEVSADVEPPIDETFSAAFPGTIQYVIPTDALYRVVWMSFGGESTWEVSCEQTSIDVPGLIADLRISVLDLEGVRSGIIRSFDSKLMAALGALEAGDLTAACGSLGAFVNHVNAQTGKTLTPAQAQGLISAAVTIRTALSC